MTKRVLFLSSDTGGGHRAGAMAIGAALDEMDKETRFEWRIDDIYIRPAPKDEETPKPTGESSAPEDF